jgi:vacuolar-type H+-ATPase subunit H
MAEHGLLDRAREREREIIEDAEARARQMREGADDYALQILDELNRRLSSVLHEVQGGIEALRPRPAPSGRAAATAPGDDVGSG